MNLIQPLSGEAVTLRNIRIDDAQQCTDWLENPRITRYMVAQAPTLEEELQWIDAMIASDKDLVLCICVRGRHIGNVGLHQIDRAQGTAEIGIFIGDRSDHGLGFATDAARTLITYALRDLGLAKVWARVYSPNRASRMMCAKIGLIEEGCLCSHVAHPTEGRLDVYQYGVLATEWRVEKK